MIKNFKTKKHIFLTLYIISLFTLNTKGVRADLNDLTPGSDSSNIFTNLITTEITTKPGTIPPTPGTSTQKPNKERTRTEGDCLITDSCYFDISSPSNHTTSVKIYNYRTGKVIEGKEIFDLSNSKWKGILAGTYIGINISEYKVAWTEIKVRANSSGKKMSCACVSWGKCPTTGNGKNNGTILQPMAVTTYCPTYYTTKWSGGCPSNCEPIQSGTCSSSEGAESWCQSVAPTPTAPTSYKTQSYNIRYPNSNDITEADMETKNKVGCSESVEYTGEKAGGKCRFNYSLGNACIDVKTGNVKYIEGNTCEGENEYLLEKDGEYYKYFIPLNANSKNDITIKLESALAKVATVDTCNNLIEKNDNFYQVIISATGEEFNSETTKKYAQNAIVKAKGCKYVSKITIPIEQKFYNEVENSSKFKGFNFYYKPIDINNPFPNGIGTTSLWNDWNNSGKDNPDLTESYEEVTYEALNINASKVRNYNKDKIYTSWKNMTHRGLSNFIDNEGIINRKTDKNNIYALGCGPENENEFTESGEKNPLYQKECDKS